MRQGMCAMKHQRDPKRGLLKGKSPQRQFEKRRDEWKRSRRAAKQPEW